MNIGKLMEGVSGGSRFDMGVDYVNGRGEIIASVDS